MILRPWSAARLAVLALACALLPSSAHASLVGLGEVTRPVPELSTALPRELPGPCDGELCAELEAPQPKTRVRGFELDLYCRLGGEQGLSCGPRRVWLEEYGEGTSDQSLFTGHYFDTETQLYYAKARYFDPELGRFLSQDSYLGELTEPPSLHRYLYAHDRPTYYVDPDGHNPLALLEAWRSAEQMKGAADWLRGKLRTDAAANLTGDQHYMLQVLASTMDVPAGAADFLAETLSPGGASMLKTGRVSSTFRGYYAQQQDDILAAGLRSGTLSGRTEAAGKALLMQPLVAVESLVVRPIQHGASSAENFGTHTYESGAAFAGGRIEQGLLAGAEAGNDLLQAFNGLATPLFVGEGALTASSRIASRVPATSVLQSEIYLAPPSRSMAAMDISGGLGETLGRLRLRAPDVTRLYRNRALGGVDPVNIADPRLVVDMPYVGKGASNANAAGWLRDSDYYWREVMERHPEAFSDFNRGILAGRTPGLTAPVNDATFRGIFRQYDVPGLRGKTLMHHHIGGGGQAFGIPEPLHQGLGGVHNIEKALGLWGGEDSVAGVLERLLNGGR